MKAFHGETFSQELDGKRLASQLERVKAIMRDGEWHTLAELAEKCEGSEAGVSARVRDLRRPECGGYTVKNERVSGGLWRYRLIAKLVQPELEMERAA